MHRPAAAGWDQPLLVPARNEAGLGGALILELAGDEVIEGSLLGSESGQSFTELLEIRAWPLFFPIADYNSKGLHITDPRGTS